MSKSIFDLIRSFIASGGKSLNIYGRAANQETSSYGSGGGGAGPNYTQPEPGEGAKLNDKGEIEIIYYR